MRFQRDNSPAIEITDEALCHIRSLALDSVDMETGGILIGFNVGRDIRISTASDAGPHAKRSAGHFLRDTEYCRHFLAREYAASGADYVGEWHSHVAALGRLSIGDLKTIATLFVDPDYDFLTFAIILVVMYKGDPELLIYVAERGEKSIGVEVQVTNLYRGPYPILSGH